MINLDITVITISEVDYASADVGDSGLDVGGGGDSSLDVRG